MKESEGGSEKIGGLLPVTFKAGLGKRARAASPTIVYNVHAEKPCSTKEAASFEVRRKAPTPFARTGKTLGNSSGIRVSDESPKTDDAGD